MSDTDGEPERSDNDPLLQAHTEQRDARAAELDAVLDWARQVSALGGTFARLVTAELQLALGDLPRLLIASLLMVPLLILTWVGAAVLLGWLVYQHSLSVTLAIGTFVVLQLVALGSVALACRHYRKSLSLPTTRRHLKTFMTEARREPRTTGH